MESYKKCPLKKRPVNYALGHIETGPENLSTKPEDLSVKRKSTAEDNLIESKRPRTTNEYQSDNYIHPVSWNSSFVRSEIDYRSLSPSTDSCVSGEYYRETSVSPPAVYANLSNIHLRGLNRREENYIHSSGEERRYWEVATHYSNAPTSLQDQDEPQDLTIKNCIPLPALYHGINELKSSTQENAKLQSRYNCHNCGKSYTTFSGLSKHQQFHCPAAECNQFKRFFKCDHCDKCYTSSGALKMHIRTHTLPCKCPTCGKAFSRPWLLQGHIRTHTGEKPFKCQYCARAFADRSNLRAHLQTHAEVKKYVCVTCKKSFSRMSLLTKHTEGGCCHLTTGTLPSLTPFLVSPAQSICAI